MYKEKVTTRLRKLIDGDRICVAPTAWDCTSAMLVQKAGFDAINFTGFFESSCTGSPDAELATTTERAIAVSNMAEVVDIPIFVDIDTGGHPVQIMRTIRKLEKAGAAGIYIEDQQIPKGCGHWPNVRVIPEEEMRYKLKACIEARQDEDFVVIAKVCSLDSMGLDKTIERSKNFEKCGADVIFVEAPRSIEELEVIGSELKRTYANVCIGGKTPILTTEGYEELNFNIVAWCGAYIAYLNAVKDYLKVLKEERTESRLIEEGSVYTLKHGENELWDVVPKSKFIDYYKRFYPAYKGRT